MGELKNLLYKVKFYSVRLRRPEKTDTLLAKWAFNIASRCEIGTLVAGSFKDLC